MEEDINTEWEEVSQAGATQGSFDTTGTRDGGWFAYRRGSGFSI